MSQSAATPTNQQQEAITIYAGLLDEARNRLLSINFLLTGQPPLPPGFVAEFGYLQLRMLCEVVAIGCLVAHGDIEATKHKKLQREYAADHIMKHLEKLHQNFYPFPVTVTFAPGHVHIERVESGYLTKKELINLYHECGDFLHRGSLEKLQSTANPKQDPEVSRVLEWLKKFEVLLRQHHIASITNRAHLLCFLSHEQANGNSFVALAQSPELDEDQDPAP
jgi:hypothetical protein